MSLGSFENRAKTCAPFVRALCLRVSDANPEAKFLTGGTGFRTLWLTLAVLIGLVEAALIPNLIFGPWRADIAPWRCCGTVHRLDRVEKGKTEHPGPLLPNRSA